MKFILNKTSGINQIENILLEKILKVFSFPENIEINIEKDNILDICLEYPNIDLNIYYVINLKSPQNHTIHFVVKKLYLTDSNFLEEAEEIKKALPKIIEYLKDNKKLEEYKIERRKNSGIYYFDNYGIAIFYQKIFNRKVIEKIDISLPSENNVDISNLGKLLGIEILKQIL